MVGQYFLCVVWTCFIWKRGFLYIFMINCMVCYKMAGIRTIDKRGMFLIIADNIGMIKKNIMEFGN